MCNDDPLWRTRPTHTHALLGLGEYRVSKYGEVGRAWKGITMQLTTYYLLLTTYYLLLTMQRVERATHDTKHTSSCACAAIAYRSSGRGTSPHATKDAEVSGCSHGSTRRT